MDTTLTGWQAFLMVAVFWGICEIDWFWRFDRVAPGADAGRADRGRTAAGRLAARAADRRFTADGQTAQGMGEQP